jgi:hypothetical protein
MNQINNSKADGLLSWWLAVATKDLAVSSKKRIAREIGLHYAEAVESHLAQGESEDAAPINALKDLGEPKAAAKKFRRSHLTRREEQKLLELKKKSGILWQLAVHAPALAFVLFWVLPRQFARAPLGSIALWAFVMISLFLNASSFYIIKWPGSKSVLSSLLILEILRVFSILSLLVLFYIAYRGPMPALLLLSSAFLLFSIIRSFNCWKKIRKMTDKFDKTSGIAS